MSEEINTNQSFLKKRLNIFGKGIPVFVLALFLLGGIGSAALVGYFARISTTVTVEAPITLEQSLFSLDGQTLNDGQNHYLLVKGQNHLSVEVPAIPVITITRNGQEITNTTGLHLALDAGGDMHYCYDPDGDMTDVNNCDVDYVQWLTNNPDWFDWLGTDATLAESGFVSPVINHGGNSWLDGSTLFVNGVMTLPETGIDSGLIAALLVIRAEPGIQLGNYNIAVEFKPV